VFLPQIYEENIKMKWPYHSNWVWRVRRKRGQDEREESESLIYEHTQVAGVFVRLLDGLQRFIISFPIFCDWPTSGDLVY